MDGFVLFLVIVVVAVLATCGVAFTGIILFVGLVVPHAMRMLVGPGHRMLLPASASADAIAALGGALIGYVLPLASALSHTVSLAEFVAWAALAGVIQIATFVVVSRLAFRNLASRVEAGDMAAALYLAAVSICVGLLNAACMTS